MIQLLMLAGCMLIALLMFGAMIFFLIISLNNPETVSEARQSWISRRSDKDERGW